MKDKPFEFTPAADFFVWLLQIVAAGVGIWCILGIVSACLFLQLVRFENKHYPEHEGNEDDDNTSN